VKYFLLYFQDVNGGSAVHQQSGGMTVTAHRDEPFGVGWQEYDVAMPSGVDVSQCVAQAAFSAQNDTFHGVQGQDAWTTTINAAGTIVYVYGRLGPSGIPQGFALTVMC
jgi:hypothetical protein